MKKGGEKESRECPNCHGKRIVKAGTRDTRFGLVQRFKCDDCHGRFSDKSNIASVQNGDCRLSAILQEAKKLDTQAETKTVCAGEKDNLIDYAWLLKKKHGNCDDTISLRVDTLTRIRNKGVNLANPDTFETALAVELLTQAQKYQWVSCYTSYTKVMKIPWDPIRIKYEPKQPYIPTTEMMVALIAASSKSLAALLQVALTTGARIGEICQLKWTDIDNEKCTIAINNAEKGSRNRTVKVPPKTVAMISVVSKKYSPHVFNPNTTCIRLLFGAVRKRLAETQNNPKFLLIHLHTFRHFFATETFRRTKSLDYVKYALGHKSIINTERYKHCVDFGEERYTSAVATTVEEVRKLAEDGWSYFQEVDGIKIFRKPLL
jgi:integrase